jgi:hypothetical protein
MQGSQGSGQQPILVAPKCGGAGRMEHRGRDELPFRMGASVLRGKAVQWEAVARQSETERASVVR